MDRLVFAAMTGARAALGQLAITANNLANASTPGFREQIAAFRAVPMGGDGANTRAFTLDTTPGSNFQAGVFESTGNPLDVAIQGDGFFVVRRPDGSEALTRAGNFKTNVAGELVSAGGLPILGAAGPIVIPPNSSSLQIGDDGTVVVFDGATPQPQILGKLRLVKPDPKTLSRAGDGLFEVTGGQNLTSDPTVFAKQGFVEGSNVSVAAAMVALVEQQRLFDMNIKMIQNADANARSANGIMTLSRG
ncbi:MAG: flagellar basal body rod protein FlgF [Betaproteobacteria bacterium]|nr:flagellar basal body rod protein FlgF [Betaproteobacteria bacterium]NBT05753.1 flagellar basal body rod protein FlgF [Betaproteobacteria bacterium]